MGNKMWGGRFGANPDPVMEDINASIDFDRQLYRQDIAASKAHAAMLAKKGIITAQDAKKIAHGLDTILSEIESGQVRLQARARGHPYECREPARGADRAGRRDGCTPRGRATIRSRPTSGSGSATPSTGSTPRSPPISARSPKKRCDHADTVMPGFTHLQPAQPVTFGHHLLAYVEMAARDRGRFADGAGAPQRKPARRRGARRHLVSDRSRHDGEGARFRTPDGELARRRRRPRFRAGDAVGRRHRRPCICRASPRRS